MSQMSIKSQNLDSEILYAIHTRVDRFMPVTNRMAQENVPVILREIADGLQWSFESETSPLDRYTSVPDTLTTDQERRLVGRGG